MDNLLNNESVRKVQEALNSFNASLKIEVLKKSARTAKDAANALSCDVGAIVKSLLLKIDDGFILCLVSGDKKCSLNKIKKLTEKKDVCMANADEVKANTGFSIGGVSPVAHITNLDILIDNSLSRFEYVFGAAGHPNCVFKITYNQLIKITNGSEKEISV